MPDKCARSAIHASENADRTTDNRTYSPSAWAITTSRFIGSRKGDDYRRCDRIVAGSRRHSTGKPRASLRRTVSCLRRAVVIPIDVARRAVPLDCVLSRWRQRRAEMGLLTRDNTNRRGPWRMIVGFEADGARADGDFGQHEGRDTHRLAVDEHTRAHRDGVDRQGSIKPGTRNRAARRGRGRDRCINSARSRFDPCRCDRFLVVGEARRDKRGGVGRPLNRCGGLDGGWCRGWRNDRLRRSHRRWGGYLHKDYGHQHTSTRGAQDDSP